MSEELPNRNALQKQWPFRVVTYADDLDRTFGVTGTVKPFILQIWYPDSAEVSFGLGGAVQGLQATPHALEVTDCSMTEFKQLQIAAHSDRRAAVGRK